MVPENKYSKKIKNQRPIWKSCVQNDTLFVVASKIFSKLICRGYILQTNHKNKYKVRKETKIEIATIVFELSKFRITTFFNGFFHSYWLVLYFFIQKLRSITIWGKYFDIYTPRSQDQYKIGIHLMAESVF